MSTTLPLFWHLSSASKADRIDASVKLVGALEQFQSKFTPFSPESSSEEDHEDGEMDAGASNDGLDGPNAPDVSYSIRRLVRGLASPRESSRLGFAVALTELLSRLTTVSASQIISLITQTSQVHGSMKGQEERDMLFARLFGIASLIRSGILFPSGPPASSCIPDSTIQDFQDAMTMLLALPSQKSFLKEPSYWILILALRALDSSRAEWKDEAWPWIVGRIFVEDKTWSPEKVGVALTMQAVGVESDWKALLAPTFKNGDMLSSGSLSNLAKILRDVDIEDPTAKSKGSAVWKPQLHFVWNIIFDTYFPPPSAPSTKVKPQTSFLEFFRIAVDESLLAPTSSDGRKLWGFELFRLSLSRVPAPELPRLFAPNFMRSWVNHLSKPDRYLHKAARLVASSLPPVITANPSAGFPLLLQLIQTNGHFDRLTRTKTVESMLAAMDAKGVHEYVIHLGELAHSPNVKASNEANDATATRIWVADQFMALVRNGAIPKTDAWITEVLNFLVLHGLFGIRKKKEKSKNRWLHTLPDPVFSDAARAVFRTRLLSCLAELTSQITLVKTGEEKIIRRTGVASDGELWVSKVLYGIVTLEKDVTHVTRLGPGDDAQVLAALRDQTLEVMEKLRDVEQERKDAREGAELLLAASLLYRYINDEREGDEDVKACLTNVARLFPAAGPGSEKKKKKKKKPANEDDNTNDTDVPPIDVLVDILISYLERSTAYLRVIANQVFGLLTALVEKSTIDLVLTQLERRDPTRREDEDEEMITLEDEEGHDEDAQSDEDSPSSDSSQEDEEDDDEDIEEDLELRKKIEAALRVNGIQAATEGSKTSGSDSSDEGAMDDDQMMQLDKHLVEIFRSRAQEKSGGDTGAQREATHFKNRVLDLVDIFLRKHPTSKYAPYFLLPLVQIIMGTGPDEKQLSDKVSALLRSRVGKAKEFPTVIDLPETREVLGELHAMARKTHSPDVRDTISACSLYLTRILLSEPVNDSQSVIEAYRLSLADFATRKASPLQPGFIQDFMRRQPRTAWQFRNDFLQVADKAVNVYRKCQTFQLLHPLLNQFALVTANHSDTKEFMRTFCIAIYATVSDACDDPDSLSAAQVKDLLKLSLLAVRQTKRVTDDPNELRAIWDATSLTLLSTKLASSRFKSTSSLHGLCKQLHAVIGFNLEASGQNGGERARTGDQKKRKAEDTKDEIVVKKARRKKTKKHRD